MKKSPRLTNRVFILFIALMFVCFNTVVAFAKVRRTAPLAPTGLNVTSVTSSEVNLSWTASSGASGYKVFKANNYDSSYTQIATVTGTSFKSTGLTASSTYWYFVRAYSSYGTSADSTHIKAVTNAAVITSTKKQILGYTTYYYSGDKSSYNSMSTNTSLIDEIATNTYTTDASGNITGLIPVDQISYANSNNIRAMAMVSNNFDGNIAKAVLESSTNRQTLINNIVSEIKAYNYKGVNIDFEGVFYYDRSYLTTFMSELYNTLHPQGYYVTMAVPAKTADSLTNSWNGAFDYATLAQYNDQIVIMAYDEHYPGGTPGPIASIGWVTNVANYAVTVIPKEKIMLGVAAYGYDWSSNGTKAYGINGIYNLAATYSAQILWDSASQSPYFSYTDSAGVQHTVWFENNTSVGYKLDIVNNLNLNGIAIWRLGLENQDYWTTIKSKFNR